MAARRGRNARDARSPFLEEATKNRNEQGQLKTLATEFGWLNVLRSNEVQSSISDPEDLRKLRWIHISVSVRVAYLRILLTSSCVVL
jgi:hypothetical protein